MVKNDGIVINITKEERLALPLVVQHKFVHVEEDGTECKYMAYEGDTDKWHHAGWGGYGNGTYGVIRVDTPNNRSGLIIYEMEQRDDGSRFPVKRIEGDFLIVWT